jgi:hypothetical protein
VDSVGASSGSTAKVRARILPDALLQIGFDNWRNPTVGFERSGNNHQAGASDWYLSSNKWQEAVFTDPKH